MNYAESSDCQRHQAASGSFWLLATAAKGEGIPDDQLCVIDPKKADISTRQVTNAGHVKKGIV